MRFLISVCRSLGRAGDFLLVRLCVFGRQLEHRIGVAARQIARQAGLLLRQHVHLAGAGQRFRFQIQIFRLVKRVVGLGLFALAREADRMLQILFHFGQIAERLALRFECGLVLGLDDFAARMSSTAAIAGRGREFAGDNCSWSSAR